MTARSVDIPYDRSRLIHISRRDLLLQRVRYSLAGVALFAAGVATAGVIWR